MVKLQCITRADKRKVYTLVVPSYVIERLGLVKGDELEAFINERSQSVEYRKKQW